MDTISHTKISWEEFDTNYQTLKDKTYFIGIFKGAVEATTGKNWCSDCEAADPIIKSKLIPEAKTKNLPILEVSVGDKATWKDPQFALRKNPLTELKSVPTVGLFNKGKLVMRLEESQINEEFLEEMLQDISNE